MANHGAHAQRALHSRVQGGSLFAISPVRNEQLPLSGCVHRNPRDQCRIAVFSSSGTDSICRPSNIWRVVLRFQRRLLGSHHVGNRSGNEPRGIVYLSEPDPWRPLSALRRNSFVGAYDAHRVAGKLVAGPRITGSPAFNRTSRAVLSAPAESDDSHLRFAGCNDLVRHGGGAVVRPGRHGFRWKTGKCQAGPASNSLDRHGSQVPDFLLLRAIMRAAGFGRHFPLDRLALPAAVRFQAAVARPACTATNATVALRVDGPRESPVRHWFRRL